MPSEHSWQKEALGLPVYAVNNTAKRWMTTVNYDLLIYDDKLVVVRGLSWKSAPRDSAEKRRTRSSWHEIDERRVGRAARASAEDLQRGDAGNRLLPGADIARAQLRRGLMLCRLRLELGGGERWRLVWLNISRNADYGEARAALRRLLGAKLNAD